MKKLFFPLSLLLFSYLHGQKTLQEKLGYTADSKLLIVHADDLGVSHSENAASIFSLEYGSVSSASIMVPTPWFPEIAAYARIHPQADLGLHLTLTSEWKFLKWGPVAPKSEVKGMVNKAGFLFESADSVQRNASASEVEKELRAQIEKALLFGIDVTHLDSHMGTLYGKKEFLEVMINLGKEYKIPVMLVNPILETLFREDAKKFENENIILIDNIFGASPQDFKTGMGKYYTNVLRTLQPGVSLVIIHAAYDDKEMQAVTTDHPDWGAAWRQADFDFFNSAECRKLISENHIRLVTWREIRDKLLR